MLARRAPIPASSATTSCSSGGAGLSKGDVVTFANGVPIKSASQFRNLVGLLPVGTEMDLRYRRGAELRAGKVKIEPSAAKLSAARSGGE